MVALPLLGAILAGGGSRRFGSDKVTAVLDGRALALHARDHLAPFCDRIVLCGADRGLGITALSDRPAPGLGPLGGIAAALVHARAEGFDAVLTIAADTPRLSPGLLARLVATKASAFVPEAPTIALWGVEVTDTLLSRLENDGDRSIRAFARTIAATPVPAGVDIPSVNAPEDLMRFA